MCNGKDRGHTLILVYLVADTIALLRKPNVLVLIKLVYCTLVAFVVRRQDVEFFSVIRSSDACYIEQHVTEIVCYQGSISCLFDIVDNVRVFAFEDVGTPNEKRDVVLVLKFICTHRSVVACTLMPIIVHFFTMVGEKDHKSVGVPECIYDGVQDMVVV